jgi:hypothetical protein
MFGTVLAFYYYGVHQRDSVQTVRNSSLSEEASYEKQVHIEFRNLNSGTGWRVFD